ncbi:Pseudouridine synthase, RluA family [[Clostridium] ultunense Esp]|nr:Pseudouridine synthase, RluA family [[Clostridium] ultunense Esp]
MEITILYEDNHLLGVVKPIDIPSQGDESGDPDLLTLLKEDLKKRYHKPGNVFLGLVHRLDRPVGGSMIFAKTSKAASRLSESIRTHQFQKEYLAVIRGSLVQPKGRLIHHLLKDERTNTVSVVPSTVKQAKEAILEYEVLDQRDGFSLLRVHLITGRPHQIRVQMAAMGTPLYGDQKYGAKVNKPGEWLALWSYRLSFLHPTNKEMITLTSLPPLLHPWDLFRPILSRLEADRSTDADSS